MTFHFTESEQTNIISHYGRQFYEKLTHDLALYPVKWELDALQFVDYYSVNCIFTCRSKKHGDAVLKIGNPCKEVFTEVHCLSEYHGGRFCRIYNSDMDRGVILEQRVMPGIRLREEKSLEKRLLVFSKLYNGLHIPPRDPEIYPTYFEWVSRITKYMRNIGADTELCKLMEKAKECFISLCRTYSKKLLLHGDLHHDNILFGENNEYKIIDPKGVVGDPIFDIPRFILNEFYTDDAVPYETYRAHVNKVADFFETSLNVPQDIIKKCLFIETTMGNCWNVESNEKPDMNAVLYSEAVMND